MTKDERETLRQRLLKEAEALELLTDSDPDAIPRNLLSYADEIVPAPAEAKEQEPSDYSRLRQQALAISSILQQAGIGSMPLDSGVLELARRATPEAQKWQAFNGPLPNGQGKLLVTNNLTATDARGHKSHVWVVDMVHANEHYGIFAFDSVNRREPSFLTHFIKLEDLL